MSELIVKVVVFALLSCLCIVLLKSVKSDVASVLGVCATVLILVFVADDVFDVLFALYSLSVDSGIDVESVSAVVKVVGIGYIAEFGNNLCIDSGCKSVGDAVLLTAKISILLTALPIVYRLFDLLKELTAL